MAKIIYRKPCRGKTLKLIQECFYNNRRDKGNYTYILVADRQRALWLANFAKKKAYDIPFPITVSEYIDSHTRGTFIRHILIDDADDILAAFLKKYHPNFDFPLMTIRKTEENWYREKGE